MSPRAFRLLLLSTCVAVGAAIWLVRGDTLPDSSRASGVESVAPFAARSADVAKIAIETPDYALTLEKKGDGWTASNRGDYPARPAAVANLLSSLASMRLAERKTVKADLFKEIGVEDRAAGAGSTSLAFEYASGAKAGGVLLGKRANSASFDQAGATFVRRAGEAQAWLAQGAANVPREFSDWFAELPAIPATEVQRVTISEGGRVVFDAKKDAGGLYARADAAEPAANDTAVKRVAQALVGTGFEDVKPASAIPAAKRSVRLELEAGAFIEAIVGEAGGQTFVRYEGNATGPAGDVIKQTKGFAFRLPNYRTSGLTQSVAELTAPEQSGAVPPDGLPPGLMQGMPPGFPQGMPHGLPPDFPGGPGGP